MYRFVLSFKFEPILLCTTKASPISFLNLSQIGYKFYRLSPTCGIRTYNSGCEREKILNKSDVYDCIRTCLTYRWQLSLYIFFSQQF